MLDKLGGTKLPDFHDGFFDGFRIGQGRTVDLFLRTEDGESYTFRCQGVETLRISGARQGNIIFDVFTRRADELIPPQMDEFFELSPVDRAGQQERLFAAARARALQALVITAHYGAECRMLCEAWECLKLRGDSPSA